MSQAKAMPMRWLLVMPMSMTYAKAMPRAMAMARVTVKDKPMAQAFGLDHICGYSRAYVG